MTFDVPSHLFTSGPFICVHPNCNWKMLGHVKDIILVGSLGVHVSAGLFFPLRRTSLQMACALLEQRYWQTLTDLWNTWTVSGHLALCRQLMLAQSLYSHKITPARGREGACSRGCITLQHQRLAALIWLQCQKVSLDFLFNGLQDFLFYPFPFFLPSLSPSLLTRGLEWCTLPFLKTPSSAGSMEYTSHFDLSFVWVRIGRPSGCYTLTALLMCLSAIVDYFTSGSLWSLRNTYTLWNKSRLKFC